MARKKRNKYSTGRQALILVAQTLIVLILLVMVYAGYQWARIGHGRLNLRNLEAYQDTGPYTNIALFGLDAREGQLDSGTNSDTMIIASIKNKTKEVRLVSVYRDCIMKQKDGTYAKANSAYSSGGGEEAIALLNRNLDLDIKNYVSVNFAAMIKAIDAVGGIEVDVTEEEISYINGYATEIIKVTGIDSKGVDHAGRQTLNGVCATAYARIRYTEGGDFKRTERQRYVLSELLRKAKKLPIKELSDLVDEIMPMISTSLSATDVLSLAVNLSKYELLEAKGFPFEVSAVNNPGGMKGAFVVPVDLAKNVKELHTYLFNNESYTPSSKVQEISNEVIYVTGVTPEARNVYDQDEKNGN
ncbi:MAG: LCP family protein [Lachnospiraceae bacterium]|nr:LCP family protein [Lachnospiraceae bacterium]